jgi:DNA-directed RNA polymerase omega subunit
VEDDANKEGTFLLVNVAAQRARQLMQGAPSVVRSTSRKPAAIAIREVEDGLVPFYMPEDAPPAAEESVVESQEAEAEE